MNRALRTFLDLLALHFALLAPEPAAAFLRGSSPLLPRGGQVLTSAAEGTEDRAGKGLTGTTPAAWAERAPRVPTLPLGNPSPWAQARK